MNALTLVAGRFAVRSQLGIGGLGVLYHAWDGERGHEVALRIATSLRPTEETRDRIQTHFARFAAIQDHRLVPLYDCGISNAQLWYTTGLARGLSLDSLLVNRGALPPAHAVEVAAAVAAALVEPHAIRLPHLAVSLRNIFVDGSEIQLGDHGLTTALFGGARGSAENTPASIAPEQLRGEADERTDIYGIGACLFQLLVGRPAFADKHGIEQLGAELGWKVPRPSELHDGVPHTLDLPVLTAMAQYPEDRYQRVEDLYRALIGWAGRERK